MPLPLTLGQPDQTLPMNVDREGLRAAAGYEIDNSSQFNRGWQSAGMGEDANALMSKALWAKRQGDEVNGSVYEQQARDLMAQSQQWAPTVQNMTDVTGLRSGMDWMGGAMGNMRSSLMPAVGSVGGGIVGGVGGYLAGGAKGAATGARYGAGIGAGLLGGKTEYDEAVSNAMMDPGVRANKSYDEINNAAMVKGGINAGLESLVPMGMAKSVFGMAGKQALKQAAERGLVKTLGKEVSKNAAEEFATEFAQSLVGQGAQNSLQDNDITDFDYKQALNEGAAGAVAGGGMGAVGGAADVLHSKLNSGVEKAKDVVTHPLETVTDAIAGAGNIVGKGLGAGQNAMRNQADKAEAERAGMPLDMYQSQKYGDEKTKAIWDKMYEAAGRERDSTSAFTDEELKQKPEDLIAGAKNQAAKDADKILDPSNHPRDYKNAEVEAAHEFRRTGDELTFRTKLAAARKDNKAKDAADSFDAALNGKKKSKMQAEFTDDQGNQINGPGLFDDDITDDQGNVVSGAQAMYGSTTNKDGSTTPNAAPRAPAKTVEASDPNTNSYGAGVKRTITPGEREQTAALKSLIPEGPEGKFRTDLGDKMRVEKQDKTVKLASILRKQGVDEKILDAAENHGTEDHQLRTVTSLLTWINDGMDTSGKALQAMVEMHGKKAGKLFKKAYEMAVHEGLAKPDERAVAIAAKLERLHKDSSNLNETIDKSMSHIFRASLTQANIPEAVKHLAELVKHVAKHGTTAKQEQGLLTVFGTKENIAKVFSKVPTPTSESKATRAGETGIEGELGIGEDGELSYSEATGESYGSGERTIDPTEKKTTLMGVGPKDQPKPYDLGNFEGTRERMDKLTGSYANVQGTTTREVGIWTLAKEDLAGSPEEIEQAGEDMIQQYVPKLTHSGKYAGLIQDVATGFKDIGDVSVRQKAILLSLINKQFKYIQVDSVEADADPRQIDNVQSYKYELKQGEKVTDLTAAKGFIFLERNYNGKTSSFPVQTSRLLTADALKASNTENADRTSEWQGKGAKGVYENVLYNLSNLIGSKDDFTGRVGYRTEDGALHWLKDGTKLDREFKLTSVNGDTTTADLLPANMKLGKHVTVADARAQHTKELEAEHGEREEEFTKTYNIPFAGNFKATRQVLINLGVEIKANLDALETEKEKSREERHIIKTLKIGEIGDSEYGPVVLVSPLKALRDALKAGPRQVNAVYTMLRNHYDGAVSDFGGTPGGGLRVTPKISKYKQNALNKAEKEHQKLSSEYNVKPTRALASQLTKLETLIAKLKTPFAPAKRMGFTDTEQLNDRKRKSQKSDETDDPTRGSNEDVKGTLRADTPAGTKGINRDANGDATGLGVDAQFGAVGGKGGVTQKPTIASGNIRDYKGVTTPAMRVEFEEARKRNAAEITAKTKTFPAVDGEVKPLSKVLPRGVVQKGAANEVQSAGRPAAGNQAGPQAQSKTESPRGLTKEEVEAISNFESAQAWVLNLLRAGDLKLAEAYKTMPKELIETFNVAVYGDAAHPTGLDKISSVGFKNNLRLDTIEQGRAMWKRLRTNLEEIQRNIAESNGEVRDAGKPTSGGGNASVQRSAATEGRAANDTQGARTAAVVGNEQASAGTSGQSTSASSAGVAKETEVTFNIGKNFKQFKFAKYSPSEAAKKRAKPVRRDPNEPTPPKLSNPLSLIKKLGGIDPKYALDLTGERAYIASQKHPGVFRVGGLSDDGVREALHDAHWISDSIEEARELISSVYRGEEVVHPNEVADLKDWEEAMHEYDREKHAASLDFDGVRESKEKGEKQSKGKLHEDVASAKEHILKTLGTKIATEFKRRFADGTSGEWEPGQVMNTIRIALNGNVMGTAFHESFHEFMDILKKNDGGKVIALLERAAMNPIMQRRLERALDGHPEAIAQLKDPSEAVAFMYQFWSMNPTTFKVGPETKTAFQSIKDFFKDIAGFFSETFRKANEERKKSEMEAYSAEQVMRAFSNGAVADDSMRKAVVEALNKTVEAHEKAVENVGSAFRTLTNTAGKLVFSAEAMMDATGNSFIADIARLFHQKAGTAKGATQAYSDGLRQMTAVYMNKLENILMNYSKEDTELARKAMASGTKATDRIAKKLQGEIGQFFEEMAQYVKDNDVRRLEYGPNGEHLWRKIEMRADYFPQVWSTQAVEEDVEGFNKLLLEKHMDKLEFLAKQANQEVANKAINDAAGERSAPLKGASAAEMKKGTADRKTITPEMIADAITTRLLNSQGHIEMDEDVSALGITPAATAVNRRELDWLDKDAFDKFKEKDVTRILSAYTRNMVRRAEYQKRFGYGGEKLREMVDKAVLQEMGGADLIKQAEDATPDEIRAWKARKAEALTAGDEFTEPYPTLRSVGIGMHVGKHGAKGEADHAAAVAKLEQSFKAIQAMEGTLGSDISASARAANSWLVTYQNFRTLSMMLFTSFQDVMGMVREGGEMGDAWTAFVSGIREIKSTITNKKTPSEMMERAEFWGAVDAGSFLDSLGEAYGSVFMTGKAKKMSDAFFKYTGAEGWNRGVRAVASQVAERIITEWKRDGVDPKDLAVKARVERLFGEGFNVANIKLDAQGRLDITDAANQAAVTRWVLDAVPAPTAAHRPIWGSDPHFQTFMHLKNYTYTFHRVAMKGAVEQAKLGNYRPALVLALGYAPIAIAGGAIKEMLIPGDEPPWMKGGLDGYLQYGWDRAGVLGVPQMYANSLFDLDPAAVFGPTVDQVQNALSIPLMDNHSAIGESLGALPGGNLLKRLERIGSTGK